MKLLLAILFTAISLFAQSQESCYTVQLMSRDNSQTNLDLLKEIEYPKTCKVMAIGTSLTVRCGCFETKSLAKEKQNILKDTYSEATVVSTYKYRFDENNTTKEQLNSVENMILAPKNREEKSEDTKITKAKSLQDTCYTVQLVSIYNSKKNKDLLRENVYPKNCKVMEIGKALTVRCGCFDEMSLAKEQQDTLQKDYSAAAIVNTYKYRFDTNESVTNSVLKEEKTAIIHEEKKAETTAHVENKLAPIEKKYEAFEDVSSNDEELRLMLQVFLAKTDLESAYEVATKGYEANPNSYYWNEKMAEICQWTNRSARSMKHMRFMYDTKYDAKLEAELIQYGSESYQYEEIEPLVVNRALREPSEKNIDLMIRVFKEVVEPEKVVEVLETQYYKDTSSTMLLTKALSLSLEMGDLELTKKYVNMIEKNKPYSKKDASLIARYYYIMNDIENAYNSLLDVTMSKEESAQDNIKYYQLTSDLGWYLQKNKNAASASKYLMEINEARFVDYERISYVYQKDNPELAASAVKRAYYEHKLSYLFYSFANEAINLKHFDILKELIEEFDAHDATMLQESIYWIIKSKVYEHYNEPELVQTSLYKALELDPNNYQIKLTLLWFFMDIDDSANVKEILSDMSENQELGSSYYLPIASAYFYLQDINRASYYTQKLIAHDDEVTKLTQFKFLQAYIYQIQNNEPGFMSMMNQIVSDLKEEADVSPGLKKQDEYLSNYLRAGMNVWAADKFEKKLSKAKEYLTQANYDEISYSWAVKNGAYEKSFKIYHKMKKKELWVQLSNSMLAQDHTKIENLLDLYLSSLAMGDASQASSKDGQIALSQTITFEGLLNNDDNQNAYIQHRDLSKERSDLLDVQTSYFNRDPLIQNYVQLKNRTYLQKGFYLYGDVNYASNSTIDENLLVTVPEHTLEADMGLRKIYDRGYIEGHIGFHDAMQSYASYSLMTNYDWSTDISTNIVVAKNETAQESTQLYLGGKKDMLSLNLIWKILDSTSMDVLHEYNRYSSQDEVDLGNGNYSRLSLNYQIRNGYPDMRVGAFYDVGTYSETTGSRGIIDKLQKDIYPVLPQNFYNVGLTFAYGMANSEAYTRVWRPYFEFYPYYNETIDAYNYGFNIGYGGKAWHQDHMSVGASYSDSVNGIGGTVFEIFLKYQFMYYHP